MIRRLSVVPTRLWRRALPWLALAAAMVLFTLGARRAGERAARTAERLQRSERTSHVRQKMLEAGADRPRDRADLAERLRKGGF